MSTLDYQWIADFRRALAKHDPPNGLADDVVGEVQSATRESGRDAHATFGDPGEYADLIADERITARQGGLTPLSGRTPGELLRRNVTGLLLWLGLLVTIRWLFEQRPHEYNWRLLLSYVLLGAVLAIVVGLAPALRAAGRIRVSWAVATGSVLLAGGALIGLTALRTPEETTVELPAAATIGGIAALALLWQLLPHPLTDRVDTAARDLDDEAWSRRLRALLRGRHAVPGHTVVSLVAQAREHRDATGRSFEELFGPADAHARSLARRVPATARLTHRAIALDCAFGLVALAFVVAGVVAGSPAVLGTFGTCLLLLAAHGILLWRQHVAAR